MWLSSWLSESLSFDDEVSTCTPHGDGPASLTARRIIDLCYPPGHNVSEEAMSLVGHSQLTHGCEATPETNRLDPCLGRKKSWYQWQIQILEQHEIP